MSEALKPQSQACKKCNSAIYEGHAYELGDDRWHIDCFKCFKCEKSLGCNSSFLVLGNGSLVCSKCSYSCKQCHKKIDDLAILTGDQAYCSECFTCRVCKSKIEDLRYARTSKGLFCMTCHEELIAKKRKHNSKRKQNASPSRPSPFGNTQDISPTFLIEVSSQKTVSSSSSVSQKSQISPSVNKSLPPAPKECIKDIQTAGTEDIPRSDRSVITLPDEPRPNTTYDIEEVNDSDDELHLRRAHESIERRYLESSGAPAGAILDLINTFSAPNTPVTLEYTTDDKGSLENEKKIMTDSAKNCRNVFETASTIRPRGWPHEPPSPHRNLLLLSPRKFHDSGNHSAQNAAPHAGGSSEDIPRPRSVTSSPMARANRQARVVETSEDHATTQVSLEHPASIPVTPGTPADKSTRLSPPLASPPPRLALPEVPVTPKQTPFDLLQRTPTSVPDRGEKKQPHGLGLDVVISNDMRDENHDKNTEVVGEGDNYNELEATEASLSRLSSIRSKMSFKHMRSTSNGSTHGQSGLSAGITGISNKLSFLRPRDEQTFSKGHSRNVSEGSGISNGSAFTTPPLPSVAQFPLASDSIFLGPDPSLLEMRSIKMELHQLDLRRQALLAENMRLNSDKSRLTETIGALQKRVASDTVNSEALIHEVEDLLLQRAQLKEDNQNLRKEKQALLESAERARDDLRSLEIKRTRSSFDNTNDTFESGTASESIVDEGAEAQKATRLKFWRRPKVTIANTNSQPQQTPGNGISHSVSTFKLGPNLSTNSVPFPSQYPTSEELHAHRKTLNSFVTKSRSTTILDSFASGPNGPTGSGHADVPLLTSTLQKRATFENEKVPLIITKCIEEVEARGLDMQGIYRLSGGNSAICAIERAFANISANGAEDKRQMARITEVLNGDINAVTSALKRYLRKLPDPLIPIALYDSYIRIGQQRLESAEFCSEFKTSVLNRLPSANKHALYLICKHLHKVNESSHLNRMNFKNLSVVFAPTIARDATGEREMIDMGHRNDTTELLFSHFEAIFSDYMET